MTVPPAHRVSLTGLLEFASCEFKHQKQPGRPPSKASAAGWVGQQIRRRVLGLPVEDVAVLRFDAAIASMRTARLFVRSFGDAVAELLERQGFVLEPFQPVVVPPGEETAGLLPILVRDADGVRGWLNVGVPDLLERRWLPVANLCCEFPPNGSAGGGFGGTIRVVLSPLHVDRTEIECRSADELAAMVAGLRARYRTVISDETDGAVRTPSFLCRRCDLVCGLNPFWVG